MNNKIILAGLANNKTSLGEVFRRYIECFKNFSNPDIFDFSNMIANPNFKIDFYDSYKGIVDHDVRFIHSPFHLYRNLKKNASKLPRNYSKKIGYFVWESSELHSEDAEVLKDFDEIWTASEYCVNIFSQYIDSSKIKIIPHPIPNYTNKLTKFEKFTLLIIGNLSSNIERKNIKLNLQASVILKNKFPNIDVIFKTFTVSNEERSTLKTLINNSNIKVIDEYYSSEQLSNLIAQCHATLSLHKSEGFGLTLAEAMRVNTVPIATGYSGNLEFMKDYPELLVNYKLEDVTNPYFKGQWAAPNLQDAISKVSNIINSNNNHNYILSSRFDYSEVSSSIKQCL